MSKLLCSTHYVPIILMYNIRYKKIKLYSSTLLSCLSQYYYKVIFATSTCYFFFIPLIYILQHTHTHTHTHSHTHTHTHTHHTHTHTHHTHMHTHTHAHTHTHTHTHHTTTHTHTHTHHTRERERERACVIKDSNSWSCSRSCMLNT